MYMSRYRDVIALWIIDSWVYVEPNPSCEVADDCDGSYSTPFPTIDAASKSMGYDYSKLIMLS